jgi:hypothetical protein
MKFVAVCAQTAPMHCVAILQNNYVFTDKVVVFNFDPLASLAILQSRLHETWMNLFKTTMKDDRIYTIERIFETFPFPVEFEASDVLRSSGEVYNKYRATVMVARDEGLTKTYNRFHDRSEKSEDIKRLRELHAEMDRNVLIAYGWSDLAERADAIFLDQTSDDDHTYQGRYFWPSDYREEVLVRLLALNAERAEAERSAGIIADPAEDELVDSEETD